ncbi:hypothetical protein CHH80_14930 [Bacillus sp. 7504-2]|nr:hypothetical protein CHH80_14930 [Bacillus sp. 7504-2]
MKTPLYIGLIWLFSGFNGSFPELIAIFPELLSVFPELLLFFPELLSVFPEFKQTNYISQMHHTPAFL